MVGTKGLKGLKEWWLQADYDYETAEVLFNTGRYIYCVFFCHLAVEKVLKGIWEEKFKSIPPNPHDLVYLAKKLELNLPNELREFLTFLNRLSVPTRYPETLKGLLDLLNKFQTYQILTKTQEILEWIKKNIKKS